MTYRQSGGQILIIGVLLLLLLIITIPTMIFLNDVATRHGTISQQRLKGRSIAEEGAAFAVQQLTNSGTSGILSSPTILAPLLTTLGFNGSKFKSSQGGSFQITCLPGLESYQLLIKSIPYDNYDAAIPGAAVATVVSQHTVGVKQVSGLSAGAALDVAYAPIVNPGARFDVELGPIVSRQVSEYNNSNRIWNLDSVNDTRLRPRKFVASGISGPTRPRSEGLDPGYSDKKEYWAYTSPGFPIVIDSGTYQFLSKDINLNCPTPTGCSGSNCNASPLGSCYFPNIGNVPTDTAIFDGLSVVYSTTVIYIIGNATFKRTTLDVNKGAVIVVGNLTLDTGFPTPSPYSARLPPTAVLEDPYSTCLGGSPCSDGHVTDRHRDIKGFLYVTGNLDVLQGTPATPWGIEGVVRVDGSITLETGSNFLLTYNDIINHDIRTRTFELQVDSTTAIAQ